MGKKIEMTYEQAKKILTSSKKVDEVTRKIAMKVVSEHKPIFEAKYMPEVKDNSAARKELLLGISQDLDEPMRKREKAMNELSAMRELGPPIPKKKPLRNLHP